MKATPERAYATAEVKVRLHQRRFRELVVSAYRVSCAMCRLHHGERVRSADIVGVDPEYRACAAGRAGGA